MSARETTINIRASAAEKEVWRNRATDAGFVSVYKGHTRGDLSAWLRALANREVEQAGK